MALVINGHENGVGSVGKQFPNDDKEKNENCEPATEADLLQTSDDENNSNEMDMNEVDALLNDSDEKIGDFVGRHISECGNLEKIIIEPVEGKIIDNKEQISDLRKNIDMDVVVDTESVKASSEVNSEQQSEKMICEEINETLAKPHTSNSETEKTLDRHETIEMDVESNVESEKMICEEMKETQAQPFKSNSESEKTLQRHETMEMDVESNVENDIFIIQDNIQAPGKPSAVEIIDLEEEDCERSKATETKILNEESEKKDCEVQEMNNTVIECQGDIGTEKISSEAKENEENEKNSGENSEKVSKEIEMTQLDVRNEEQVTGRGGTTREEEEMMKVISDPSAERDTLSSVQVVFQQSLPFDLTKVKKEPPDIPESSKKSPAEFNVQIKQEVEEPENPQSPCLRGVKIEEPDCYDNAIREYCLENLTSPSSSGMTSCSSSVLRSLLQLPTSPSVNLAARQGCTTIPCSVKLHRMQFIMRGTVGQLISQCVGGCVARKKLPLAFRTGGRPTRPEVVSAPRTPRMTLKRPSAPRRCKDEVALDPSIEIKLEVPEGKTEGQLNPFYKTRSRSGMPHAIEPRAKEKPPPMTWPCVHCDIDYESKWKLYKHKVECHQAGSTRAKGKNTKCRFCPKTYSKKILLRVHEATHNAVKKEGSLPGGYECHICFKQFGKMLALRGHMAMHTGKTKKDKEKCTFCGELFSKKRYLKEHLVQHINPEQVTCEYCGVKLARRYSKKLHVQNTCPVLFPWKERKGGPHGKRQAKAKNEVKKEVRKEVRKEVKKEVKKDVVFDCCDCTRQFVSYMAYQKHLQSHAGLPTFQCDFCEKAFFTPQSYRDHNKLHTNPDAFACKICGSRYTSRTNVIRHMVSVHGKKGVRKEIPQAAPKIININQTTIRIVNQERRADVRNPIYKKGRTKPYCCPDCPKAFKQKTNYFQHVHSTGKLRCKYCTFTFVSRGSLKRHETLHRNPDAFKCFSCCTIFASESGLKVHKCRGRNA